MKAEDYSWECPNCHSDDYEEIMHCATFHTDPSSMEKYFTNPMKCLECGEVWDEVYLLVEIKRGEERCEYMRNGGKRDEPS